MSAPLFVCDSQVHAPDTPHLGDTSGMNGADLIHEMDRAGVHGCVLVPLEAPGPDTSANNEKAQRLAASHPDRFTVMGRLDVTARDAPALMASWRDHPYMSGVRLALHREPARSSFDADELDSFWSAAEKADVPIMVLAHHRAAKIERVARKFPGLRIALDHAGLAPRTYYEKFDEVLSPVLALASCPNVAVKASALPCSTREPYPFTSLHAPIRWLVDAFGAHRVFWGSDLTRLPCSYTDCVRLFAEVLDYLTDEDRRAILGGSVVSWLRWGSASRADAP